MKKQFSKSWNSSRKPRKQRKYLANAPLHIKKKFVSINLSKQLREKQGKKNIPVRKGDKVKVLRGKFKKKEGKITKVFLKQGKITMEGIQVKKRDRSNAVVKLQPSNLQITELNTDDRKRKIKRDEVKAKDSVSKKSTDKGKENVFEKAKSS